MRHSATVEVMCIALAGTLGFAVPAWSETECFKGDFYEFLVEFQNKPAEQASMSADQITITTFQEMGRAMPRRYIDVKAKEDLSWPLLPSLNELERQGLKVDIYEDPPLKAEFSAEPTDHREISYTWLFEKNPCWRLVEFRDGTLHR